MAITVSKALFLDKTPLFGDEALYCYLGTTYHTQPFSEALSLTINYWKDAPGLIWLNAINLLIFGQSQPIEVCRFTSVLFSAFSAGVFYLFTGLLINNPSIRFWSLVFLLLNPLSFFFDRTSLMDPPQVFWMLLYLYFSLKYLKDSNFAALIISLFSYVAMFTTKFNALINIPIVIGLNYWNRAVYRLRIRYYVLLVMVVFVSLMLSVRYTHIWETVFYHVDTPLSLRLLVGRIITNLRIMLSWYRQFFTPLVLPFLLLGTWHLYRKKQTIIVWIFLSIIGFYAVVSINLFPRYLLLTVPFIALIVGYSAYSSFGRMLLGVLIVIFIFNGYRVIMEPSKALLAQETRYEYFEDWGSGIGTKQAIEYFVSTLTNQVFIVVPTDLEGLFRIITMHYAPQLHAQLIFFRDATELRTMLETKRELPIFIIATPYHEWITTVLRDFSAPMIYATNKTQRNSILIYANN